MVITLYKINCPQCNVLKKKLDTAGISYSLVDDIEIMKARGYTKLPVLVVDDIEYSFSEAVKWINGR